MTRDAQGELGLHEVPLENMEVKNSVLVDKAHIVNSYYLQCYGSDALEANTKTEEFYAMDQQLDECYLMTICRGG